MDNINRLSKIALVASDQAYDSTIRPGVALDSYPDTPSAGNPDLFPTSMPANFVDPVLVGLSEWKVLERIGDSTTGFGATIYTRDHNGKKDYMVAFQGTRGPNPQDWGGNLFFGLDKWSAATGGGALINRLIDQELANMTGDLIFTGQSLGGALAEYAAYDFKERVGNSFANSRIALVTFNGLGGIAGLQATKAAFDSHVLDGSTSRHYWVVGDIVHRLGAGTGALNGQVHLNGNGTEYRLDFYAEGTLADGSPKWLSLVDAHRIESGFYAGLNRNPDFLFSEAQQVDVVPLQVTSLARFGAGFGNLLNADNKLTFGEATSRLMATLLYGFAYGDSAEAHELVGALAESAFMSGRIGERQYQKLALSLPGILGEFAKTDAGVRAQASALVLAQFLETFETSETVSEDLRAEWNRTVALLGQENIFGTNVTALATQAAVSGILEKVTGKSIDQLDLGSAIGLRVLAGTLINAENKPQLVAVIGQHKDELIDILFAEEEFVKRLGARSLIWLTEQVADAYVRAEGLAILIASVGQAMASSDRSYSPAFVRSVKSQLQLTITDALESLANSFTEFTRNFQDTLFDFGQSSYQLFSTLLTGFRDVFRPGPRSELNSTTDYILATLGNAARDEWLEAVDEAIGLAESAGQMVVLSDEHPVSNPFDVADFDPATAPLLQTEVKEGGVKRFTLSLPYGAGKGGQQIAVTLNGTAAPNVRLLAGGEEVLPQGGVYTVSVPQGERELELSFLGVFDVTEPGLTGPGTLSVSATLVDSAGQLTHQTHIEANVEFGVREDLVPDEPFPSALTAGNDTVLISTPLAGAHLDGLGGNDVMWGDSGIDRFLGGPGDDRLYGSFRLYFGANDSDWLSGGAGNDQLLGHEGDDLLEGDSGSDAVLGDIGNDVLFAGSQADYATIFTLGGADDSGDLVQGGAGDDLVVGSAGADALSGGNGTDLILGGGGNDEIRGDTEFVPTHTFHIIGTTFPPEQPFAGGADVLYGNAGDDILLGEAGDDRLYGGEGFDNLTGGEGKDELYGGAGDDFLVGDADSLDPAEHADDYLHGGEGSDVLLGHGGDDTLVGDAGDDFLEGGDGNDSYVFNRGDGADTVFDFGSNTVRFGPGIDATDLKLGLGSLFIRVGEGGDAIRIVNFDPDDVLGTFAVDVFEFLNGERLSYPELIARGFDLEGTNENDFVRGTSVTDRITGGEGNDELDGAGGMDILAGGPGDDIYHVDDPGDAIEEAIDEGHDSVQSTAASYVLGPNLENLELIEIEVRPDDEQEGDGGEITITGGLAGTGNELDNEIDGNSLNNVLDGGGGNDRLAAESGSDTYIFGRGSGADTIVESDEAPGDVDAIQVGSDVLPGEVTVLREENDLILAVRSSPDRVRIQDWFVSDAAKIELAFFDDGTAWDSAMLEAMAAAGGTNSAPVLVHGISDQIGFEDAVFSFALPADAFVDADMGDTLTFGATLEDGAPLPGWLSFDGTSQVFSGMPTNDDVGAFDIAITATDGGGLGAADIFRLTVENTNDPPALAIAIADQNTPEDALFNFTIPADTFADVDEGDALTMSVSLAGEGQLPSWLVFDPETRAFNGIPLNDHVGTWNLAVTATDSAGATATADLNLTVENVNDPPTLAQPLSDQSGNQNAPLSFQVPEGAFLDVDAGDALLFTATRADDSPLPEWLEFDGVTRLFSGIPSEFDIGALEIRVTAADMAGASVSDDFALSISDASVVNETHSGTRRRDVIVTGFANDLIDADRGDDVVHAGAGRDAVSGGRGHDHLFGEAGNDMLAGGEGHDHLLGGLGEDLLAGGDGHDRLEGGEGHDVYLHERHGGHDTIEEQGNGFDALLLGEGITPDMARLEHRHDDLVVDLHGDHGSVTIKGWFASDSKRVETIQFADGTTWGIEEIRERASARGHLAGGHDDGDHGHHHHHSDDDDCHEASSGKKDDDREHDHAGGQRDRAADYLTAYLADEPLYDFEVLARDLELSDWRSEALSPREIARRWNRIASYAAGLSHEQDDDSRGGAAYRFDGHGLLGGALGGGFGYAGSTGATRSAANMRTLEGLKEGFHRLHD